MNRRTFTGLGIAGLATVFVAPGCGISKDKAVRYTDITIGYLKDARLLLVELGEGTIVDLIDRGIPALEKLKASLEKSGIPEARGFLDTVTGILGQVSNALLKLAESAKRDTAIGIIGLVNLTIRTVQLFVESETAPATSLRAAAVYRPSSSALAVRKAFEATRF